MSLWRKKVLRLCWHREEQRFGVVLSPTIPEEIMADGEGDTP
jgi:hypothetical protein